MLKRYAVMGYPIEHSLSPQIHHQFALQTGRELIYEKISVRAENFKHEVTQFFAQGGCGLNITAPCKSLAFAISDVCSDRCQQAQAANTLWLQDGKLYADNTDGIGFMRDLQRHKGVFGKRVLILGAGGGARGIISPILAAKPLTLDVANRTLEKAILLQNDFKSIDVHCLQTVKGHYDLLINATSADAAGLHLELPDALFERLPFCYDLAYQANQVTPFVNKAHKMGCQAVDGIGMLVEQAAESFRIWHGVSPDVNLVLNQQTLKVSRF